MSPKIVVTLLVMAACGCQMAFSDTPVARIAIETAYPILPGTPVSIDVSKIESGNGLHLEKVTSASRISIPFQIEKGKFTKLWWLLPEKLLPGEKQVYELVNGNPPAAPLMQIDMDNQILEIRQNQQPRLAYQYAILQPPAGENSLYARSGFIHPLTTPGGKILTRIHPADHIHHLGLWFSWTKTKFEGREVDFWNIKDGQGTVRFITFDEISTGPIYGTFTASQQSVDLSNPGGEKVALDENFSMKVWAQSDAFKNLWLGDFTISQRCASSSPLMILQYRYGGFGFRGTGDWDEKNSNYLTSEGKNRKDGNGTRARWCNIFGKTDRGPAGILFLSHPENHEHPEPMRIWPEGDIFFGFCPVVNADWEMLPGKEYIRQYRMVVYDGEMTAELAEQFWQNFVHQPAVKVDWKIQKSDQKNKKSR